MMKPTPLKPLREDSRGNTLYVQDNGVGGRRYVSDEIGGGVTIWDTALVSEEMLRLALLEESTQLRKERRKEGDDDNTSS